MSLLSFLWRGKPKAKSRSSNASASRSRPAPAAPAKKPDPARQLAREQLFGVIRDAMNASGVLSSSYKFKVLDLGSSGRRFAVLIHMDQEPADGAKQHIFVESVIKRIAASRAQLQVDCVYWHMGEPYSRKQRGSPLQPLVSRARESTDAPRSDFMVGSSPLSNTQYGDLPAA